MGRKSKYGSEEERKAARKAYAKARIAKLRLMFPEQHKARFDQDTTKATTTCQALTNSIADRVEVYRAKLVAQARKSSACTRVRKEYKPINMHYLKGRKGRKKGTKNKNTRRDKGVPRGPRNISLAQQMAINAKRKATIAARKQALQTPYNIVPNANGDLLTLI